jgi:hypothetical protein
LNHFLLDFKKKTPDLHLEYNQIYSEQKFEERAVLKVILFLDFKKKINSSPVNRENVKLAFAVMWQAPAFSQIQRILQTM